MKEHQILFSGPMVRAILEGQKTVTRRPVKATKAHADGFIMLDHGNGWRPYNMFGDSEVDVEGMEYPIPCPYGQPGDRLWVRETWLPDPDADHDAWYDHTETYVSWSGCGSRIDGVPPALRNPEHCIYREGWAGGALVWRPSIHMPRWASRILLEVTDVRLERLQGISDEQCIAEGCGLIESAAGVKLTNHPGASLPKNWFAELWKSTGGDWDANPWVWVIEFKRVAP